MTAPAPEKVFLHWIWYNTGITSYISGDSSQNMQDKNDIQILAVSRSMVPATGHELTIGGSVIPAGFPSPTDDFHSGIARIE